MTGAVTAYVAIGTYAYSTYKQIEATKDAQAASERQFKAEQKRADIQNIRGVREQIRATRIAQASMVNQASLSGGTGGSAVAGGVASAGSQLSGNLQYMQQIAEQNTAISTAALDRSQAQTDAAIFGIYRDVAATAGTAGAKRAGFI